MGPGRSGIGEQPFSMMALDASMRANSSGLNLDTRETSSGKWLGWVMVGIGRRWNRTSSDAVGLDHLPEALSVEAFRIMTGRSRKQASNMHHI